MARAIEGDLNLPTGGHDARPGGLRRALGGSPRELSLGAAVALVSIVFVARFGRDFWFRYDNFELLANRQLGSLNDYFRPHGDHWLTWTILVSRVLYRVVGMDYWPWWYIPRLIGHAAVAFLIWRILLHRGADRIIAFGAYVALLVLAVSYFQDALTVANYVLFPCLVVVALIVSEVDVPRRRHLVVVAACLLAALMANGYGLAVFLAVTVVLASRRRLRRWAPGLVPPLVILGAWYLRYRSELPHHDHTLSPRFVLDAIGSSFVVVRTAVQNTFGLPSAGAIVVVVAIAALLVWLIRCGRLDMFDAIVALTLALVLGTLAWARTTQGDQAETARYGYAVVLLLTLLVVPHLPSPAGRVARTAVALVLVAVVVFNAVSLSRRLEDTGADSQSIRADAETTAALIAAGEPYSDFATVGRGVDPLLIRRLVDQGWNPPRSADPAVVDNVRGRLRLIPGGDRARSAADAEGHVAPAAVGVGGDGCLLVSQPSLVNLHVTGAGGFKVNRKVDITWTDRFGTVRRSVGPGVVGLAAPVGKTSVTVLTFAPGSTNICSLAPLVRPKP